MKLSNINMVHQVEREERAIIQLCISEMKTGYCIALGRTQLLLNLVIYVMSKALKLVPLHVCHLIFCHAVTHFVFSQKRYCVSRREVFLPLCLSSLVCLFLPPPAPTSTQTPLSHSSLISLSIPRSTVKGWRKWVMWWPLWPYCFPFLSFQLHVNH